MDEYIDLVIDYIEHLRPDLVLERFVSQSPKELLIAPAVSYTHLDVYKRQDFQRERKHETGTVVYEE